MAALTLSGLVFGSTMAARAQTNPSTDVSQKAADAAVIPIRYSPIVVAEVFNGSVVRVLDDRTLVVHRDDKGRDETIRLFGVQSVATASPDGKSSARAYLTDQLKNAKVRIEGRSRDKQGTLSAIVTPVPPAASHHLRLAPDVSGISNNHPFGAAADIPRPPQPEKSLNETIVRLGLARYDAKQAPDEKSLADAENEAQKGHKGMWASMTASVSSAEKP
jgi:endonuclease YncB( thermonuclease family)